MQEIKLFGENMLNKEKTHAYLEEKLSLPGYYGKNLDALWDCLSTDISQKNIVIYNPVKIIENLGPYGKSLINIFLKASKENNFIKLEFKDLTRERKIMNKKISKICVYGIGGVGGYFGGIIADRIKNRILPMEAYFIGSGKHLQAVQKNGLTIITDAGRIHCFPNIATDSVKNISQPDLYILCIKGYDLANAAESISKKCTENTIILPLLNGVDIYNRIRSVIRRAITLPSAVYISSNIEKPGIIRQRGPEGYIVSGKDPEYLKGNYQKIIDFFQKIGLKYNWYANPYPAIWEKFIFIAPFSLVTAYSGRTIGEVLADDKLKEMTKSIMNEVVLIGKVQNILFDEDMVQKTIRKAEKFPYETKTSFQRDYERDRNRHEGDIFGGVLIRLAEKHGISIPATRKIYESLIGS